MDDRLYFTPVPIEDWEKIAIPTYNGTDWKLHTFHDNAVKRDKCSICAEPVLQAGKPFHVFGDPAVWELIPMTDAQVAEMLEQRRTGVYSNVLESINELWRIEDQMLAEQVERLLPKKDVPIFEYVCDKCRPKMKDPMVLGPGDRYAGTISIQENPNAKR